jgi:hypothetical protein
MTRPGTTLSLPEAPPAPPAPSASEPASVPALPQGAMTFREFATKFFLWNTREALFAVQQLALNESPGALAAICYKAYTGYLFVMRHGDEIEAGQGSIR